MRKARAALSIGGVTPFSTVDYPGKLAAVVFCRGCVLRCAYCHNRHLQTRLASSDDTPWGDVLSFLEQRRAMLDAVVFSGGEALLQPALPEAINDVTARGFAAGLHTAGLSPAALRRCLPNLSWVGFDVKAPFDDYACVGSAKAGRAARASLQLLLESGVNYEVRMTICAPHVARRAVEWAIATLPQLGVRKFALQQARKPESAFRFFDDDGVFSDRALIGAVNSAFPGAVIRNYENAAALAAAA